MTSPRFWLFSPSALLLIVASSASAVDEFNPENGHYYRFVPRSLTWDNARVVAFSQTHDGLRGHLATITSEFEQAFVEKIAVRPNAHTWLGGFQPSGSPEPDGNWQWVTGEPFSYSNWAPWPGRPGQFAEPNDVYGEYLIEMWPTQIYENGVGRVGSRWWNDLSATHYAGSPEINRRPFVIEFTPGYAPRLNGSDFLNWQRDLGKQSLYGRADFNGDAVVNGADLGLWKEASVPEPSASAVAASSVLGLSLIRRRGRR